MLLSNLHSFVQRLYHRVVKRSRKDRQRGWRRRATRNCQIERLEDRTLLSTFTVSNLLDDGSAGTLRTAVIAANANPGEDRVEFSAGGDGTILLTSGELELTDDLVIAGNGAGTTIIDGNSASRVFNATLATGNVTISGITIQNGSVSATGNPESFSGGGGIQFVSSGQLAISDTVVTNNHVVGDYTRGGGIFVMNGTVTLQSSTVSSNDTDGKQGFGGGIFAYSAHLTILNSTVSDNHANHRGSPGGGVFMENGVLTASNSSFNSNSASSIDGSGGGIYAGSGDVYLDSCTVFDNQLGGFSYSGGSTDGAGIKSLFAKVTITNSTVSFNSAGNREDLGRGGAAGVSVGFAPGSLTVINSTITGNTTEGSSYYGAGLSVNDAPLLIVNSTVAYNVNNGTGQAGAGICSYGGGGEITIRNSIVATNYATVGLAQGDVSAAGALTITSSLIGDNTGISGAFPGTGLTPDATTHNLIGTQAAPIDPVFGVLANNGGPTQTMALLPGSPAINRGDDLLALDGSGSPLAMDQRGLGFYRSVDGAIDMGAFEVQASAVAPTVASITREGESENPTSATSVNFTVQFSEDVTGVAAGQFSTTRTGTVQTGTITVTPVNATIYKVTVSGITGAGDLGLDFDSDGSITSVDTGVAMSADATFTSTQVFTIQAPVSSSDLETGGLRFHVVNGGSFAVNGSVNSVTGKVQVGFAPSGGNPFTALAELNGTISVDTASLSFSATGTIAAIIGGTPQTLFSGGLTNIGISQLINSRVAKAGGSILNVAGGAFSLTSFGFRASPTPAITIQGSVALPKGITVAVAGNNAVEIDSTGVHINGASFSLANTISIGGTTFSTTGLTANYTVAGNVFDITGQAGVAVADVGGLTVNFNPNGLKINNGSFSGLDATVNGTFTVKGVTFAPSNLHFTYSDTTQKFSFTGSASVAVGSATPANPNDDMGFNVSFGHGTTDGLVITSGALTSLDMTVNPTTAITVAGVKITASDLEFSYTASTSTYAMTGTASIAVGSATPANTNDDMAFNVAFGHIQDATHPNAVAGLVVTNGALANLDMTVNTASPITVAGVKITASNLEFTYTASTSTFAITGTASIAVGSGTPANTNDDLAFTVAFGHVQDATHPNAVAGLVVTNGALANLDMTVNTTSPITVAGVKITASDLEFTYTASNSTFAMTGTANITVGSATPANTNDDLAFSVKFGHVADGSHPNAVAGLVVTNGALVNLDMTVGTTSPITVAGVKITATDLEFQYTASSSTFAMTGTASIAVGSATTTTNDDMALNVKFSHDIKNAAGVVTSTTPGLVITNGALANLDMTVSTATPITVAGAKIIAADLEFQYTASSSTFAMTGSASVAVGSATTTTNDDMAFNVKFGHDIKNAAGVITSTTPGLVVTNGALANLDMTVNSAITIAGVKITASDLEFVYTASTSTFAMTGTASVSVGSTTTTTNDDLALSVTFGHDIRNAAGVITSTTPGLVVTNGALTSLDMTVNASITVAGVKITASDLEFIYTASTITFAMSGLASVSVGSATTTTNDDMAFSVKFGHVADAAHANAVPGLVVTNGALISLDMTVNAAITVAGVKITASDLE
ncbi:MAG: hlyA 4, partial [Planctomycetaceae bacterium]|nr:hlyA 4 [Planctomycetaceae bacterium]